MSEVMASVLHGDCIEIMRTLAPDESVDAIVTDPPYGLGFMGKDWDRLPPGLEWSKQCYRVLKPGGYLLAFGGTRTWHRLAVAVEDAGFELRDSIAWLYGSGFPKSMDVSKAIDKLNGRRLEDSFALGRHIRERREALGISVSTVNSWFGYSSGCQHWESQNINGVRVPTLADWSVLQKRLGLSEEWRDQVERIEAEREIVGIGGKSGKVRNSMAGDFAGEWNSTAPATDAAQQWQGWGTALKPAFEPIIVARKPLSGTVAANVLEHGTGALNIDGCRIATDDRLGGGHSSKGQQMSDGWRRPWMDDPEAVAANAERARASVARSEELGRWPANVVLDESQAAALDEQSGTLTSGVGRVGAGKGRAENASGIASTGIIASSYGDSGGASRFFYVAKAPKSERPVVDGVAHPTVKPLALMRWLVRLVTPPGGKLLDPFAGSGTTGEAALLEGIDSILIENTLEYLPLIQARIDRARNQKEKTS